jgi:hypothetical protein
MRRIFLFPKTACTRCFEWGRLPHTLQKPRVASLPFLSMDAGTADAADQLFANLDAEENDARSR